MNDLIGRHLQELGEGFLDIFPAVVIQGARQVGKNTFAQMLTAERPHTRLSLDDDDVREAALADPRAFAAQAGRWRVDQAAGLVGGGVRALALP